MDIGDLSAKENSALLAMLHYWVEHWDWECPTLFGLDHREFQDISSAWPQCLVRHERVAALALLGTMREFLHGASAVGEERVEELIGITHAEAEALFEKLSPRIKTVLA